MRHAAPAPVPAGRARSLIAGANALMRMKETTRPVGERLLSDPFAARLARGEPLLQVVRYARFALPPLYRVIDELQTAHCVRHRSIDELLLRAVEQDGFTQVVVLGAGWDMRAARFRERLAGVRIVELDLPAMSLRKKAAARGLCDVSYGAIDLAHEPLRDGLRRTAYNAARPTLFVLEGLVHYLPRPRVERLFAEIAGARARRRLVLSYVRSDVYRNAPRPLVWLVRLLDEIPRLHFTPDELTGLLARAGLPHVSTWDFAEQLAAFAPEGRGRPVAATQDVALADAEG
jgi:methyltransferase (TIGR00027 family)